MESEKNNSKKVDGLTDQQSYEEIKDLYKSAKRSRRVHIGFGIATLLLLGLFAVSWFTFGGLAAFWAINFTLTVSAIGCFLGAVISKIVNRKNKAKIRLLEESRKKVEHTDKHGRALSQVAINKNEYKHSKHLNKYQKFLTEPQVNFIKNRAQSGVNKTEEKTSTEAPKVEKLDWRNKDSLNLNELSRSLKEYNPIADDVISKNYNTEPVNTKISKITLFNLADEPFVINKQIEIKNDVAYDKTRLDIMKMVNKADNSVAKVSISYNINGEDRVDVRMAKGNRTFKKDEVDKINNRIEDSKKEQGRGF